MTRQEAIKILAADFKQKAEEVHEECSEAAKNDECDFPTFDIKNYLHDEWFESFVNDLAEEIAEELSK